MMSQSENLARDVRLAWRRWRRRPLLPAVALLVLITGAGAGAAILTLSYALMVQPLPYPRPDELLIVRSAFPGMQLAGMGLSGPEALELAELTHSFSDVGFGFVDTATARVDADPERVDLARVSAPLLRALAPAPRVGRVFSVDEDRPGGPDVVLLDEGFWNRRFGGDPQAIGRSIDVDGRTVRIIGVLPRRVDLAGRPVDLWTNLRYDVTAPGTNRANHIFTVVGRRRTDVTLAALIADVRAATETWMVRTGQFHAPEPRFHPLDVRRFDDLIRGPVRPMIAALSIGVLFVIGASIANVTAVLAAAADSRRGELAVRTALGASRWHLWRESLTEAAMLAIVTSAAAPLLAWALGRVVAATAPAAIAVKTAAIPSWPLVVVAGIIAFLSALIGSVVSVRRASATAIASVLAADGRSGVAPRYRARRGFVLVELAAAAVLVASAAQLVETVWRLSQVPLGFDPSRVLSAAISLPASRYRELERTNALYDALAGRLRSQPGVEAVGFMSGPVPERRPNNSSYTFEGQAQDMHAGVPPVQFIQIVTPGLIEAVGMKLVRGRSLSVEDGATTQPVVLINERAARAFFPTRDAIGGRLKPFGLDVPWMTVVGIVGDARQNGVTQDAGTEVFVPLPQAANAMAAGMARDLRLVLRVQRGDPLELAPAVRDAVRAVEPLAAVSDLIPLQAMVNRSVAASRFLTAVLVTFAILALGLASVTVYGLVSALVTATTREIGVRRSLGASHGAIVHLVCGQIAWLSAAGAAIGVSMAQAGTRWLAPFVYQAPTASPSRLAIVLVTLTLAALLATAVPLARALRIDPARALRHV